MSVLEFFKLYADTNLSIETKLDYLDSVKQLRDKLGGDNGDLSTAGNAIERIEKEVEAEIARMCEIKDTADFLIKSLPDIVQRAVMERRYLLCETWNRIAEKTGYCTRHVVRIHKAALNYLEKLYPDITL